MRGSGSIRFSELFRDTVETHGVSWAFQYYCRKHGMQPWEFAFWCKGIPQAQNWNFGLQIHSLD